jgi:DNA-binding MarR family transcriptional regulator
VTQLYDDILRPSGLRDTQFSLLTAIWAFGKVSITELAKEVVMDRTTLTRNLNLLEREGLVRIQVGEDARVREVELTPAAQKKLAAAFPYWEKAQAQVTRKLGAERLDRLLGDLSAAIRAAGN